MNINNHRVATLSGMLGIVRNLRNFAKKSGKCQENCWVFSNVRKVLGIFMICHVEIFHVLFFFCSMQEKELNVKMNLKHLTYFNHIYNFFHCLLSTRVWKIFCTNHVYFFFFVRQGDAKVDINNSQMSSLLMRNHYLMKNNLILLYIFFGMNYLSLFRILFGMHYLVAFQITCITWLHSNVWLK